MDAGGWPYLFLLALFFVGGAYFAATEIAFAAMNKLRVKSRAEDGDRRAQKALYVSQHFDRALTTILIGNNVMHIGCASVATLLVTRAWGAGAVAVSTVAVTLVVFLFCEMIPKSYARENSERFALATAGSLVLLMRALSPATALFGWIGDALSRRFPAPKQPSYTEDELRDVIDSIGDEGVLEKEQKELVQSALQFGAIRASDIAIPLEKVVMLDIAMGEAEILRILGENKFSRFPVCDGRREHVLGILQANRFYAARLRGDYRGVRSLLLPVRRYQGDMHIDEMMEAMNGRREHMVLITGAEGRPTGIATMEDILEELVGEIWDEDDVVVGETRS